MNVECVWIEMSGGVRFYTDIIFEQGLIGEVETRNVFINYLWGVYNDGKEWSLTDLDGNTYSKVGNVLTITSADNEHSLDYELTEEFPYGSFDGSTGATRVPVVSLFNTKEDGTLTFSYASFYNNSSEAQRFLNQYAPNSRNYLQVLNIASDGTAQITCKLNYYSGYKSYGTTNTKTASTHAFPQMSLTNSLQRADQFPSGSSDPYNEGGTSGTGGGTGSFDGTSDAIAFPSLPTLSAVSTGFVSLYAPTLSQINSLASYMWSGGFDIDLFRKLFADPMDVILGLSIVPVSVPTSGAVEVKVGNISTGVFMNRASTQYVNVDCGSLEIKEYWGSCLDYAPNSKCQIYLPYIGTRSLDIDEIMGKTIQVKYAVDILSGALVANIMCGSSVLYAFNGACASSIPVVSRDFTNIISAAINIAGNIGMAVATGGMSAPVTAAGAVQLGVAAGQTAMNVANAKPTVQHSGAIGGTSGILGVQTPYLIFELPKQSLPTGYNKFGGYPSNITLNIGSCSGFTKVEMIHLENIPATDSELNEIESLLKAGVIV